jgi:epoxyqueuosine reductase
VVSDYVKEGAGRYLIDDIEPFDQKNEMFKRPWWDSAVSDLKDSFYLKPAIPRDKPGYELKDQASVCAGWYLDDLCHDAGAPENGVNLYAGEWDGKFSFPRVPSGLKIKNTDPETLSREVKKAAALYGASLTGIAELDRRWLYASSFFISSGKGAEQENRIPDHLKYVIVIGIEMDYESIRYSPAHPASMATAIGYSKMAFTAGLLAKFIRGLGFDAIPAGNDTGLSIPMSIDAGLGEIARNGLLITPQFGPRLRLAKVYTNLPLIPDQPIEFGVKDFCMICEKCAQKCPSRSIDFGPPHPEPHNISNRHGVNTWHINAQSCLSFWAKNGTDCSNCIRVCPFNKPPGLLHEAVRWGINRARSLNRLYLLGDDIMGYGRRKSARHFWK